jgi:hypothetical protein
MSKNHKILLAVVVSILALVSIIVSLFVFISYKSPNSTEKNDEAVTEVENQTSTPEVESNYVNPDDVAEFTDEELKYLNGIEKEPAVKSIRTAIDSYLNKNERNEIEKVTSKEENCGLDKFDEYIKGKYVAFQAEDGKYGGSIIRIVFPAKPDKIFEVWVYELAGGPYELRYFCTAGHTANEVEILVKAFGRLFRNPKMAL